MFPTFEDLFRVVLFVHFSEKYRQKGWAIVDGNSAGADALGKLTKKFSDWPKGHFSAFDQPAFENYYPARFDADRERLSMARSHNEEREIKGKMAEDLCQWVADDPATALKALESSAAGPINALRNIERQFETG